MSNMQKLLTVLIAAVAALLPVLMLSIHWVLGLVGNLVMIVAAFALQDPKFKGKDTEVVLAAVLFSILCQIAWALVA